MTARITDSALSRHLWGPDEARAVLGEEARLSGWLEVITARARVQALRAWRREHRSSVATLGEYVGAVAAEAARA